MKGGYGLPIVRAYFNKKEIPGRITDFTYRYSEEDPDKCTFTVSNLEKNSPDLSCFQDRAEIIVIWGLVGDSTKSRKVFISDTDWSFDRDDLVKVSVTAKEKGVTLRQSTSRSVNSKTNILAIAKKMGDKHGLTTYVEVDLRDEDWQDKIPKLKPEELKGKSLADVLRMDYVREQQAKKVIKVKVPVYSKEDLKRVG
jgi:hypothetical protein